MAKAKKSDVKIQRPVQWGGYRIKPVNFEFGKAMATGKTTGSSILRKEKNGQFPGYRHK